jgi:hypothetical protein
MGILPVIPAPFYALPHKAYHGEDAPRFGIIRLDPCRHADATKLLESIACHRASLGYGHVAVKRRAHLDVVAGEAIQHDCARHDLSALKHKASEGRDKTLTRCPVDDFSGKSIVLPDQSGVPSV